MRNSSNQERVACPDTESPAKIAGAPRRFSPAMMKKVAANIRRLRGLRAEQPAPPEAKREVV